MTEEVTRHRLSMAAFYQPDQLWTAVVELLTNGLGIDQQCCAGRADALTGIEPPRQMSWELSARLWALVRCVEPYVAANGLNGIYATSGGVLRTLACACPARGSLDLAETVPVAGAGHRNGSCTLLRKHIDAGAVLLVISAENASQQAASSHVLLRNSPHGVQTFEFTGSAMH
jgi:hypothetical protein